MDEASISKSSFVTSDGQWEFTVLPFGVVNGPSAFSRMMSMCLGDLNFVEIYLDDILIHSATLSDHYKHVEIVFKRLMEVNLKLNFSKCFWFRKELKFLGHIITEGVIKTDDAKIEAVHNWSTPKNVHQVQQFLGLAGYYRKFVPNFAHIAHPLYQLTKSSVLWNWSLACQLAFDTLKKLLISHPILRMPDFSKKFHISCDASGLAVGAILGQRDEDGKEYVICYISRLLKGAELHYSVSEKEMLLSGQLSSLDVMCMVENSISSLITLRSSIFYQ